MIDELTARGAAMTLLLTAQGPEAVYGVLDNVATLTISVLGLLGVLGTLLFKGSRWVGQIDQRIDHWQERSDEKLTRLQADFDREIPPIREVTIAVGLLSIEGAIHTRDVLDLRSRMGNVEKHGRSEGA